MEMLEEDESDLITYSKQSSESKTSEHLEESPSSMTTSPSKEGESSKSKGSQENSPEGGQIFEREELVKRIEMESQKIKYQEQILKDARKSLR